MAQVCLHYKKVMTYAKESNRLSCGLPSASPSPSPSASNSSGCFLGSVPVTLQDGTVKQTEDVVVGDVVATPDGPSEVFIVGVELVHTSINSINEVSEPWVTGEHPFPKYGTPSYGVLAGWYSFLTGFTADTWPWLGDVVDPIAVGSTMMKYNATTNATTEVVVSEVIGPYPFFGEVYTYVAWPLNSPTRVPNSYMIGPNGYVAYSPFQPFLAAAGMACSMIDATEVAWPIITNPSAWTSPGQFVDPVCWAAGLAAIHGPYLSAQMASAYNGLNLGSIPTSPPSNWDGPASEFIAQLREFVQAQGKRKPVHQTLHGRFFEFVFDSPTNGSNQKRGFVETVIPYQDAMATDYEGDVRWLDWIPFASANATIEIALGQFTTFVYSYDYTSLAQSCAY